MIPIFFSQVILLSCVLVSQGALGTSVPKSRDSLGHLLTRQHDSPMDMCEDNCKSIFSIVSNCSHNQSCLCTASNAGALESCIDCAVALNLTVNAVAMGQAILDDFNVDCPGTSVPSLTVGTSSPPGATSSLEMVSAASSISLSSSSSGLSSSDPPLVTTPSSTVTQSVVAATTGTLINSSAGFTRLHHTLGLVVVVASIVLALM